MVSQMFQQTRKCNRHYICRTFQGPFLATFAANGVSKKTKSDAIYNVSVGILIYFAR